MERPPVTIGDPARPGPEPDLLVGGEDEGLGPVGRRRLKALVAVAAIGAVSVRYANRQERDEAYEVGLRVRREVADCAAAAGGALVAEACSP